MNMLLMNNGQQCCGDRLVRRPAWCKPMPLVPLLQRLLIGAFVTGALALLTAFVLASRPAALVHGPAVVELPRVVIVGKRIAAPAWGGGAVGGADRSANLPVPAANGPATKEL